MIQSSHFNYNPAKLSALKYELRKILSISLMENTADLEKTHGRGNAAI